MPHALIDCDIPIPTASPVRQTVRIEASFLVNWIAIIAAHTATKSLRNAADVREELKPLGSSDDKESAGITRMPHPLVTNRWAAGESPKQS